MKSTYANMFSVENWNTLPEDEKSRHTVQNCTACSEMSSDCSAAFPAPIRRVRKSVVKPPSSMKIALSEENLTSPKSLGRKVLQELNTISKQQFNMPAETANCPSRNT